VDQALVRWHFIGQTRESPTGTTIRFSGTLFSEAEQPYVESHSSQD